MHQNQNDLITSRELNMNQPEILYNFSSHVLGNKYLETNEKHEDPRCQKWIDIVKQTCPPQILQKYPYQKYKNVYETDVCIIQGEIKHQGDQQKRRWKVFKSKEQIKKFVKKAKGKISEQKIKKQPQSVLKLLATHLNNPNQDEKIQDMFFQFVCQVLPKDKNKLKMLGQIQVRLIELEGAVNCLSNTFCSKCRRSNNFYISITTQCIFLSQYSLIDGQIQEAIPYTNNLKIHYKLVDVDEKIFQFNIGIQSGKTFYRIQFQELQDLLKFAVTFQQVKRVSGYFENLRYDSFSFPRENCMSKFYSDGEQYFRDMHDAIQTAKKKICMTGWCITPYFLLKRPENIETGLSRLDKTLQRAAIRGVKIFILVFQQPSLFVHNDSFHVFDHFENLHKNFKVIRHPSLIIPQLWSHHQKSMIIDQQVAFMGGLDICYGRWDNHQHSISDIGLWEGADYVSQRTRGITEPRKYKQSNLNRVSQPRMPWHDIGIRLKGASVIDLQRHFVQYWYFAIRDISDDPHDHLTNFKQRYHELKRQKFDQRQITEKQKEVFSKTKLTEAQMALIQYKYYQSTLKNNQKTDYKLNERIQSAAQAFKDLVQHRLKGSSKEVFVQGFGRKRKAGKFIHQLCRSSCSWSTGIKKVEHSIYNAYLDLIDNSEQFIYIQNQFFMSYENDISQRIAQRIRRAYSKKQNFKVIVMMPLLPGFQGDPTNEQSGILRVQMQLQYDAIKRKQNSILQLIKDIPNVNDYIYFFGLRSHALFGSQKNEPKTEIIYIHSKMIIVDDKKILIGSANINDRSLLGSRDSQLAIVSQLPDAKVGQGDIFNFRANLFMEHFGISTEESKNINSYWSKLIKVSQNNTKIYRQVFGCIPDDTMKIYSDVQRVKKQAKPLEYYTKIPNLIGHYVDFPINFLQKEDLSLKLGQKQFLFPITFFT